MKLKAKKEKWNSPVDAGFKIWRLLKSEAREILKFLAYPVYKVFGFA